MTIRRYLWLTYGLVMVGVLGMVALGLSAMSQAYLAHYVSHLQQLTRHGRPGHPVFPKGQARAGVAALTTFLHAVAGYLVLIGVAALVVGLAAFRLVARRLERPLLVLAAAGHAIARGATDVDVAPDGPSEMRALAKVFNDLVASLRDSEAEHRVVLEELAHELRTPLHVLRGYLQAQRDGVYPAAQVDVWMTDEIGRLGRLADRLPRMRSVSHFLYQRQAIRVQDLLAPLVAMYRPVCARRRVTLEEDWTHDAPVLADPDALREVYHNLFSNALRHTPDGGTIRVSTVPGPAHHVVVVLEDSGAGIPEDQWDSLWHRRVQVGAHSGHGIGLSVVRAIIAGHDGHAAVDRSPLGGAALVVTLPAPDDPVSSGSH